MTLPKDRLRKIHGIAESTAPAERAVLARRSTTRWQPIGWRGDSVYYRRASPPSD